MFTVVPGHGSGHEGGKDGSPSLIDEIVREGARRMLAEALQAEVDAYIAQFAAEHDGNGRRLVVRNGYHRPREVLTSAGAVEVTVPRVNDKRTDPDTGERKRFASAILPPWCRKTPKITEVLPLLYLHGLSSGDFVPALGQFLGSAAGLSPAVITRLTETWKAEQRAFAQRDLSGVKFPKAAAKITDDLDELLAFYDYPCEHWVHLRTTNPIEFDFRDGKAPDQDHQGARLQGGRPGDGVQAHRVSARPLARGQRTPPRRPGPGRRPVRTRKDHRTRSPHQPRGSSMITTFLPDGHELHPDLHLGGRRQPWEQPGKEVPACSF